MKLVSRSQVVIPAESDLLCEGCGYTLKGLPADSRCPECGKPIAESRPALRRSPAWEDSSTSGSLAGRFVVTSLTVLARPSGFFRRLSVRPHGPRPSSVAFARLHWGIASLLLASAVAMHWNWYISLGAPGVKMGPLLLAALVVAVAVLIEYLTRLAARLTSFEAALRGLRLPYRLVLRGLHYHAPHYLPAGLLALATVAGYRLLLRLHVLSLATAAEYLYVLCAEVVVCALWLFWTYWIAMRNLMYANGGQSVVRGP